MLQVESGDDVVSVSAAGKVMDRARSPRSVYVLQALGDKLIGAFGVGKPSNTGHPAASTFWEDVWEYDPETKGGQR